MFFISRTVNIEIAKLRQQNVDIMQLFQIQSDDFSKNVEILSNTKQSGSKNNVRYVEYCDYKEMLIYRSNMRLRRIIVFGGLIFFFIKLKWIYVIRHLRIILY